MATHVTSSVPAVARLGDLHEARAQFAAADFAGAWELTLAALACRPFHPEAWLLLLAIARATGTKETARRCEEQIATMSPRLAVARDSGPAASTANLSLVLPTVPPAPRLTVCLITRNEEQFLPQCLNSIRDLAWQIVVVDTGSTDRTMELARSLGAEVHSLPWTDDFSAARNAALAHARGDWVLSLDADEELPAAGRAQLLAELRDGAVMAYRLPMLDAGQEKAGVYYVPRLFRNAPGLHYAGRIHEQVFPSLEPPRRAWGLDNRLGQTRLLHHGYTPEVTRTRGKGARNLRLLELALREQPTDVNLRMNHGLELIRAGRSDEGLREYRRAFDQLTTTPANLVTPELRETLLTQFATRLLAAGQLSEVVRILQSPLAQAAGLTASHHYLLGLALLQNQRPREAVPALQACLALRHQPALSPGHEAIHSAAPNHCLAVCLQSLGQTAAAEAAFRAALVDEPDSPRVRLDWARFLARQGRLENALGELHQLVLKNPDDPAAWELGGHLMLSHRELSELADQWTREAFARFPHHPTIARHRQQALRPAAA